MDIRINTTKFSMILTKVLELCKCRTAMFAEFNNTGKGADRSRRVKWSKSLSLEEAMPFVDLNFIAAEKWLRL